MLDVITDDKLEEIVEGRFWIGGSMETFSLDSVNKREGVCKAVLKFIFDPLNALRGDLKDWCKPETDMFEIRLWFGGLADASNCDKFEFFCYLNTIKKKISVIRE